MSRKSRVGTADKPPTVEENVGRLEVKMKEMELKTELKEKEEAIFRNTIMETMEDLKSELGVVKNHLKGTVTRIDTLEVAKKAEKDGLGKTMIRIDEKIQNLNDTVERVTNGLEHVQEKMYDFEANKKNNLIFYGIPNEAHEKETNLIMKVKDLIKTNMKIRRELIITTTSRMFTGPEMF